MRIITAIAAAIAVAGSLAGIAEAKTFRVKPGPEAQRELQEALINAEPGDTVRLAKGRFVLNAGLSLDADRVTVRGAGADKSVLDFTGQTAGAEGLLVTGDRVTLRDFAVENARGDGIKSKEANDIHYRDLRVEWMRGPNSANGAYGVYPVESNNVLIERVLVRGASDAGIYVGQSTNIIVRNSIAERNVAGIEIENSFNADVYDNIASLNTGGILVFDLPGLPRKGGHSTRVFRNRIDSNNTPNFGAPGSVVSAVPAGTGVIVMANRNVHIFQNQIGEHGTANVIITAYRNEITDVGYNALPRDIVVRDNVFGRTGFEPGGELSALPQLGVALPDVFWDGATTFVAAGTPKTEPVRISMSGNTRVGGGEVTFLSLGLPSATSPVSEAQPEARAPAQIAIPEPLEVKLPAQR